MWVTSPLQGYDAELLCCAGWGTRGGLSQLSSLIASGNQLDGSLPSQWAAQLPKLSHVDLSDNELTGVLYAFACMLAAACILP